MTSGLRLTLFFFTEPSSLIYFPVHSALYTAGYSAAGKRDFYYNKSTRWVFIFGKGKRCERLRCTYNLAEKGDFHSCLAMPCLTLPCLACLLNILKAVRRDSTIKNINVPCRFSSSFISGVRTALGFGISRIYHEVG